MIFAYIKIVVRDRASDRRCTGGSEGAINVGPPGEILGGFSFLKLAIDLTAFSAMFVQSGFRAGQKSFLFCPQLQFETLLVQPRLIRRADVVLDLFR